MPSAFGAMAATAARKTRRQTPARQAAMCRMKGPSKSRGLHPLPTCQNEGYPRVLTPPTRRQSWLTSGYQRGFLAARSPPRRRWKIARNRPLVRPGSQKNRPPVFQGGRLYRRRDFWSTTPWLSDQVSRLRLVLGRRVRTRAMLRHEEIELFLVLGVTQPVEKFAKLLLLFLEPAQGLHAIFVKGAVAA
jgi:hypothetical protein